MCSGWLVRRCLNQSQSTRVVGAQLDQQPRPQDHGNLSFGLQPTTNPCLLHRMHSEPRTYDLPFFAVGFWKSHANEYDNKETTMILVSVWAIIGRNMPPAGHVEFVW